MGIVYLVQDNKHLGTNRYKIGVSKDDVCFSRLRSYGANRRQLCISRHKKYKQVEDVLIEEFNRAFELFYGREWFKGDENEMVELFEMVCQHCKLKLEFYNLEHYNYKTKKCELYYDYYNI